MNLVLAIEYDGFNYRGWQKQAGVVTIQEKIECSLGKIAQIPVSIICAGRTDAGVHATNQIINFSCSSPRPLQAWIRGANSLLPFDIRVKWAQETLPHFHARFSAVARCYRYIIYNAPVQSALLHRKVCWQFKPLNVEFMQKAGSYLIGEHDYSSFRGADCQASTPIRNIFYIKIKRQGKLIIIDISANAFLHHMVRNIVGTLIQVGLEKKPPAWISEVLLACDRRVAPQMAVADGLYLVGVSYPAEFAIPCTIVPPFFTV